MSTEAKNAVLRKEQTHTLSNGQTVQLAQLGLNDYHNCKLEALRQYKRSMIETWTANIDLLPEEARTDMLEKAMLRAEAIEIDDLPKKEALVPLFDKETGAYLRDPETKEVRTTLKKVAYGDWWASSTPEGMLHAIWLSIRRCAGQEHWTKDMVDNVFMDALPNLEEAAQAVGEMMTSQLAKN